MTQRIRLQAIRSLLLLLATCAMGNIWTPAQAAIVVWATDDLARIKAEDPVQSANAVWDGRQITLFSARNEFVAAQLFVTAEGAQASNVNLSVSSLRSGTNSLSASGYDKYEGNPSAWSGRIKAYKEKYVKTSDGSFWPDPLIPFDASLYGMPTTVAADTTQGFWIDIWVPATQMAGLYTGSITVTSDQGSKTIPVTLTVYNFALPATNSPPYFFADTGSGGIAKWETVNNLSSEHKLMMMSYHERFAKWRISPKNTWPANPRYGVSFTGNTATIDWTETDKYGDILVNQYKVNLFEILLDDWLPNGLQADACLFGSACWQARAKSYLSQAWGHYKTKGWDKMAFVYPWSTDEPNGAPDKFAKAFVYGDLINAVSPDIPYAVTASTEDYMWDGGHTSPASNPDYRNWAGGRTLWEVVDWWIPNGRQFTATEYMNGNPDVATCSERKRITPPVGGNKCGFYQSKPPFIGSAVVSARGLGFFTWPWIAWKYRSDVDFMYFWGTTYWSTDPYNDLVSGASYPDGDGVMIYPGKPVGVSGPVDSMRTLGARRGLQDKEYLNLLVRLGQGVYAQQIVDALIPYALTEARVYGTRWTYRPQSWSDDPLVWNTARRNLASKIVATVGQGGDSTPPAAPSGLSVK